MTKEFDALHFSDNVADDDDDDISMMMMIWFSYSDCCHCLDCHMKLSLLLQQSLSLLLPSMSPKGV